MGQVPQNVSIIITCFNGAATLRSAVDSALLQTYEALEVIVVDDGSTDESPAILQSYGDRIVSVRQENAGCAAARNRAIKAATGDILVILDSDDVLLPDAVSSKVALLESDPSAGLATSATEYIDARGERIPGAVDLKPNYPGGVSFVQAMRRLPGPISGWAIPRRVLDDVGLFDASLRAVEDYDLCLRILSKYKCLCDPDVRVLYRELPGSLSRDYTHNYDHVRRVIKKSRAIAPVGRLTFWWNSKIMMLTSCAGVFTRILREGGSSNLRRLGAFLGRRPSALPYFVIWAFRAGYNRFLFLFHTGPLEEKRLALRGRP